MKKSTNDQFDVRLCMRAVGTLVTFMHSDIYEYVYHFTFKKSFKAYAGDFKDPWAQHIDDDEFFMDTEDDLVKSCLISMGRLIEYKYALNVIYGIDEAEDLQDENVLFESTRFQPFKLFIKRSKSYKRLKMYYDRTLSSMIDSLCMYTYVLTAQRYKIPLVLRRQLKLPAEENLRLVNHDDSNVAMLEELIAGLRQDLEDFRFLSLNKAERNRVANEKYRSS